MGQKENNYMDCIQTQNMRLPADNPESNRISGQLEIETSEENKKSTNNRFATIHKMVTDLFLPFLKGCIQKFKKEMTPKVVVAFILTSLIVPQILTMCNERVSDDRALSAALENIAINYSAGNYYEVEQGIISVYPILQKRKDYTRSLVLIDILLEIKYQEFWNAKMPLSETQMALIKQYVSDALEYAEKTEDLISYIKICIHQAQFYMAEYEFTLDTEYLNALEDVLFVAGNFFDTHHIGKLKIDNEEEAQLACQYFNLKNMQYRTKLYQHINTYSGYAINEEEIAQLSAVTNELFISSAFFTSCTELIADLNEEHCFIPEETICHMRICGILAYMETGNKINDFEEMAKMVTYGGKYIEGILLDYKNFEYNCNLFQELERKATSIRNYDDLVNIYEAEEEYFYRYYVSQDSEEALSMYQAVIEKMMNIDQSGSLINPCTISTGNGFVLDHFISTTEKKLNEMTIMDDAFGFCLLHYKLGTHYMSRAMYTYENGDFENCESDFIEADRHFETALLYFSEDTKGIYEAIVSDRDLIQGYLSSLATHEAS